MRQIPARPNPPSATAAGAAGAAGAAAAPLKPMTKAGYAEKLSHRKQMVTGASVWQKRYLKLEAAEVLYFADENDPTPKGVIKLNAVR